jgi:probable DNA metabolism protein
MAGRCFDGSLEGLFAVLDEVCRSGVLPDRVWSGPSSGKSMSPEQPDLFAGTADPAPAGMKDYAPAGGAAELYEASVDAYGHFLYGWMSELPIGTQLIRFAWKIVSAARRAGIKTAEARAAAERAAGDRGDPAVETVLEAAYKVGREVHRLQGLLRFSPGGGVYTARCAPDHLVLPALADHFRRRFGEAPWIIVDERRGLALVRPEGSEPRLVTAETASVPAAEPGRAADSAALAGADPAADSWEELWRRYHRSVNNETRTNPRLQRQFMPARYWKYLPECRDGILDTYRRPYYKN